MSVTSKSPIGLFDSGVGGLTVAHAVNKLLPDERLVYFGDTAHLPYGDKSLAAIQAYSVKITDVLLQAGCKVILIACNTASAAAYDLVKEYTGSRARVFNVIDPVVDHAREHFAQKRIGLIATKQTIASQTYQRKIEALEEGIDLRALATPLLVPMIEEGFLHNKISRQIIDTYLGEDTLQGIEAIILGCTHYPLIKKEVSAYYKDEVAVLDSSEIVARALRGYLEYNNLLARPTEPPAHTFMVSDYTDNFEHSTRLFFGKEVRLQKHKLWE
ncbi:MAG: glutamate racemase [Cyclobacteriaceae bacterium]